ITEEGRAQLAERHTYARTSSSRMVAMTVTGSLMLLTVALLAARRIRNDIRLRQISEQELLTQTVQLIGAKNAIEQQAALLESKTRQLEQARLTADDANDA